MGRAGKMQTSPLGTSPGWSDSLWETFLLAPVKQNVWGHIPGPKEGVSVEVKGMVLVGSALLGAEQFPPRFPRDC